jgi:hypothetical protein
MAALAATNSATPSLQSTLIRSRIDAARREADQAESYAQSLRVQADAQERVVQQARQRVQTVEKAAGTLPTSPSRPSAPSPQADPTYINALAEVFQAAKPILKSDLSPVQQNLVKSSLLDATKKVWVAPQTRSPSPQPYQTQVFQTPAQTMGRVLDTSA